jgi:hypothetical protein
MQTIVEVKRTQLTPPPPPPPPEVFTISLTREQAQLLGNFFGYSSASDVLSKNRLAGKKQVKNITEGEVSDFMYNLYLELGKVL